MTQAQQPDAQRLADIIEQFGGASTYQAAAELRRLHAENTTLQQGYDAARLEIEALRVRAAEPAGVYPPLPRGEIGPFSVSELDDGEDFYEHMAETWSDAERFGTRLFTADQMRAYVDADRALRAQAAPAYIDSTPELHVADSAFESWYSNYLLNAPVHQPMKQRARDAYAAGMGDPMVMAAPASGNWVSAADVDRLVRELDVALNGEEGAAPQASLCDVVGQAKAEAAKLGRPLLAAPAARQCVECASCGSAFEVDTYMAGYTEGKGHCLNCPGINRAATEAAPAAVAALVDRADATNLARNIVNGIHNLKHITPKGIQVLAEAVMAMDAALQAAPELALCNDTLYLLRRLLSNQHTLSRHEFMEELTKIVGEAYQDKDEVQEAYSIDADPYGIRATVADAITGALAFGAQGVNKPPECHWLTPFWEAARASAQPAVAAGWMPIETAPKDTLILLYGAKRLEFAVGMHHSRDGWVSDSTSEFLSMYPPTHWTPLPPAPKE